MHIYVKVLICRSWRFVPGVSMTVENGTSTSNLILMSTCSIVTCTGVIRASAVAPIHMLK